jgi:Zn ribbon nucleic-acid-binding protein
VAQHNAKDRQVSIEVAWCPACQADCTVEVIALADDPEPVALCVDCGLGVDAWWLPELVTTTHEVDGAGGVVRAS